MRERSESVYATLIIVSGAMIVLGILLLMLGMGAGTMQLMRSTAVGGASAVTAVLGAIGLLGGIALLTFTMISGAAVGATEIKGPRQVDPNTRVIARYAVNRQGETLTLEDDFPDPKTKFYVRLQLGDGNRAEFQCVKEVYDQCGEGMRGESHFQGRWLGMFRPYIGTPPTP